MKKFYVPTILKSKPTGKVGKHGNIYQNTVEYTQFKRESLHYLKDQKPEKIITHCEGIAIFGYLEHKGRAKDSGQLQGAIYDILTTAKIWKDDNLRVFNRSISEFRVNQFVQGYVVYICETTEDWITILYTYDCFVRDSLEQLELCVFPGII